MHSGGKGERDIKLTQFVRSFAYLNAQVICECENCGKDNVDPEPNEEGEFICEHCGALLPLEVCGKCFGG